MTKPKVAYKDHVTGGNGEGIPGLEEVVKSPTETSEEALEKAANLLLTQLEPRVRDFAIEVADIVLKIKRWHLFLGSLLAQYESGSLVAPALDPGWMRGEVIVAVSRCRYSECDKEFEPKRYGQLFCSNVCGAKATKTAKEERVARVA